MSHHAHPSHDGPAEGGVQMGKILAVGGVSLATFAVSAIVAWVILARDLAKLEKDGKRAPAAFIGKDEVGIVDTIHFDSDNRLEQWRLRQQKRLSTYGWVDKAKGVVHIPIEKAMDEVVTQYGAGGATERKP